MPLPPPPGPDFIVGQRAYDPRKSRFGPFLVHELSGAGPPPPRSIHRFAGARQFATGPDGAGPRFQTSNVGPARISGPDPERPLTVRRRASFRSETGPRSFRWRASGPQGSASDVPPASAGSDVIGRSPTEPSAGRSTFLLSCSGAWGWVLLSGV